MLTGFECAAGRTPRQVDQAATAAGVGNHFCYFFIRLFGLAQGTLDQPRPQFLGGGAFFSSVVR
ncbi:MAG: hypothetical protein FWK04_32855 [Nostoc sp. GBBB01]|nr:hypothetical protein [Nostoc sp. GBBB01]